MLMKLAVTAALAAVAVQGQPFGGNRGRPEMTGEPREPRDGKLSVLAETLMTKRDGKFNKAKEERQKGEGRGDEEGRIGRGGKRAKFNKDKTEGNGGNFLQKLKKAKEMRQEGEGRRERGNRQEKQTPEEVPEEPAGQELAEEPAV